jgi:hypothetical protein
MRGGRGRFFFEYTVERMSLKPPICRMQVLFLVGRKTIRDSGWRTTLFGSPWMDNTL